MDTSSVQVDNKIHDLRHKDICIAVTVLYNMTNKVSTFGYINISVV